MQITFLYPSWKSCSCTSLRPYVFAAAPPLVTFEIYVPLFRVSYILNKTRPRRTHVRTSGSYLLTRMLERITYIYLLVMTEPSRPVPCIPVFNHMQIMENWIPPPGVAPTPPVPVGFKGMRFRVYPCIRNLFTIAGAHRTARHKTYHLHAKKHN